MPAYGHNHCSLCNVPVCPDCIGNYEDSDTNSNNSDDNNNQFCCQSHPIDIDSNYFSWLLDGIALYENGDIYDVISYDDEQIGVLLDKQNSMKYHYQCAKLESALFLHKKCYYYLLEKINLLPVTIWWFLAVYHVGITSLHIYDITDYYHCQQDLCQYYSQGYDIAFGKPEDHIDYKHDNDYIWLLHNPDICEKKRDLINKRFNQMLITYDWTKDFEILGYKLISCKNIN